MTKREEFFKSCILLFLGFTPSSTSAGEFIITQNRPYYYILAFSALLFIPIVDLVYKLLRFQPIYQLSAFIYLFIFMLYTLGIVLQFYSYVPHFDKIAHTFSGAFVSFLALILFICSSPAVKLRKMIFPWPAYSLSRCPWGWRAFGKSASTH